MKLVFAMFFFTLPLIDSNLSIGTACFRGFLAGTRILHYMTQREQGREVPAPPRLTATPGEVGPFLISVFAISTIEFNFFSFFE